MYKVREVGEFAGGSIERGFDFIADFVKYPGQEKDVMNYPKRCDRGISL